MVAVRAVVALLVAAVTLLPVAPAGSAAGSAAGASPHAHYSSWRLHAATVRPEDYTDQGLATLTVGGRSTVVTRGDDSIPPRLAAAGWRHVGDPDSAGGYLLDAYQGPAGSTSKLFVLTTPAGTQYRYLHPLAPGEAYNNSFTAIAPDARWFVSGEWGTMRRLLVFAMPSLPPAGPSSRPLPLSTVITLDRPVRDVQGCAFASPTALVCSTNDRTSRLFGVRQQLLTVTLGRPLDGRPVAASVSLLGPVPGTAACHRTAEVEGIDVHGRRMLVSVVSPCTRTTTLYDFRRTR